MTAFDYILTLSPTSPVPAATSSIPTSFFSVYLRTVAAVTVGPL